MTDQTSPFSDIGPLSPGNGSEAAGLSPALAYAAALGLVAVGALAAFVIDYIAPSPNVALILVLPVLIAALSFGWGPALVAAIASVAVFDFFFIEPIFSLRVAATSDLWALGLLLVVAAIASAVAAQSRSRALEAQLAADRAQALHRLAHLVVQSAPKADLYEAAVAALAKVFQAPAVVLLDTKGALSTVARSDGAVLAPVDQEAARWAAAQKIATRADQFPFDAATFSFWPIDRAEGATVVLGVRTGDHRPDDGARFVEMIGAYVLA